MDLSIRDFNVFSIQAALFTPGETRFRASSVLAAVLTNHADRYDGDVGPTQLSLPGVKGLPSGVIPSFHVAIGNPVALSSSDKRWKFTASASRLDSIWQSRDPADGRLPIQQLVKDLASPLIAFKQRRPEAQVGRVAIILRRWAPLDDPAPFLAAQFCKPELVGQQPLRHSRAFRIENLKQFEGPIGTVNSWVRCHSNIVHKQPAVSIEQDINTREEAIAASSFSEDSLKEFFAWIPDRMDEILSLYFPGGQTE